RIDDFHQLVIATNPVIGEDYRFFTVQAGSQLMSFGILIRDHIHATVCNRWCGRSGQGRRLSASGTVLSMPVFKFRVMILE
ncbi:hypothetical protein BGZ46_005787, partial [Entomortierella lignicola]